MLQICNLLTYLGEHSVTTLLVSVQHGLMGPADAPAAHVSYLADTVVLTVRLVACGAGRSRGRGRPHEHVPLGPALRPGAREADAPAPAAVPWAVARRRNLPP